MLVELFMSKEKYLARISQLDVQLTRLQTIFDGYNAHLNTLKEEVMEGDDDNFQRMYDTGKRELETIQIQIQNAQTCRAILQKTVEQMDENQTKVEGILDDVINTTGNIVTSAKDAAEIASTVAGVAAIL